MEAKGWWGKQIVVDSAGNAEKVQLGSPRRLATIYQTNMQSAYMAGRMAAALETTNTHPYWMYIAVNDSRTRPSHRALHGKVFRWDDPIWQHILPPNGYNCRCRFIALTAAAVKRRGLTVESSEGMISSKTVETGVDKRTGEIYTSDVTVLRTKDALGKAVTFSPDPGFDGSPMQSHLMDDVLFRKAQNTLAQPAAIADVQQTLLNPVRLKAWSAFVDRSLARDVAQGQTMGFGVMQAEDINFVLQKGAAVQSGILFLEDSEFLAGTLTAIEWKSLPNSMTNAEQVLWDVKSNSLLYILATERSRTSKIAIRFNRLEVVGNNMDDAAAAFTTSTESIDDGIQNGIYERVR